MKHKIINSVLSQTLFIVISGLVALVLVPLLIKMLGVMDYGAFELISSLMIVTFLLEFGMGATLVKYIPEHKEHREELQTFIWSYFYIKLSVTLLGSLAIMVIGYHFESIFKLEEVSNLEALKSSVYIFAVGVLLSSLSTFLENILKGFVYFGYVNLSKIVSVLLFFLLFYGYYLFSDDHSLIAIATIWFALRPTISILNALLVFKKVNLLPLLRPTKFDYSYIKATLPFLFGMSYITIVAQLSNQLPKVILGALSGPVAVGYWGIMDRVQSPLLNIQSATLRPLVPILSDKKYHHLPKHLIFQASRLYYALVAFIGLLIILNIDTLISLWIGHDFQEVARLIKVLLLPFIFPNMGVLLMMYYAKGETKINSIFLTFNTVIGIALSTTLLIVYDELIMFLYGYVLTTILLTSISIVVYLRHFKLNPKEYFQEVILPILLVMSLTVLLSTYLNNFFPPSFWGLMGSLTTTSIIYLLLFVVVMKKEDREMLRRFRG